MNSSGSKILVFCVFCFRNSWKKGRHYRGARRRRTERMGRKSIEDLGENAEKDVEVSANI
jgi:hypothetical protein